MMKSLFVLLLAGILTTPVSAAESYKWVDAEGHVQYSQTPPPKDAQEVEKVELAPSTPAEQPTEAEKPVETEETARSSEENPIPSAETDPNKKPLSASEEIQAIKKQNCDNARNELTKLSTANAQIVIEDKETPGKFVPLSDEERQQKVEKAQAYLDAFCKE